MLYRPEHNEPDSGNERRKTRGFSLRATPAGLPLRHLRPPGAALRVQQPTSDGENVRRPPRRGPRLPLCIGACYQALLSGKGLCAYPHWGQLRTRKVRMTARIFGRKHREASVLNESCLHGSAGPRRVTRTGRAQLATTGKKLGSSPRKHLCRRRPYSQLSFRWCRGHAAVTPKSVYELRGAISNGFTHSVLYDALPTAPLCYARRRPTWQRSTELMPITLFGKMKRRDVLIRWFLYLWCAGCIVMLPAFWSIPPWSDRFIRLGCGCVCLACCANILSALRTQRMWGRFSIITPNEFGGLVFFRVMIFLNLAMAGICAWGATTFKSA